MSIISNRYLQGSPILPYANVKAYAGSDIFMDVEFVDHTQTPVTPTTISLEIDDITNAQMMYFQAVISAAGSNNPPLQYGVFAPSMTFQFSSTLMQMTFPYEGSQLCQFKFSFIATDSVTGVIFTAPAIAIVELCSLSTVSGAL